MKTLQRALLALAAASLVAGMAAPPASALSFQSVQPFDAMVSGAALAVRGKVLAVTDMHAAVPNSLPLPYTAITLRVDQSFAGSQPGATLVLRQLGGRLAGQPNRMLLVPGLAEFDVGDEVYVIADDRRQPFFATLYGDQGLFRVATDAAGVRRVLNHGWQPMQTQGQPWRTDATRSCKPRAGDRQRCDLASGTGLADRSDTHDVAARPEPAADVTVAAFEARLRNLRAGKPALPGQTVSADAARFETALAQWRSRSLAAARTSFPALPTLSGRTQ
jgi:hypothetical protein